MDIRNLGNCIWEIQFTHKNTSSAVLKYDALDI